MTTIVVVTGSRRWSARHELNEALSEMNPDVIVHGGAAGADALAGRWANEHGVTCIVVPALWASLGSRAGSVRNIQMLEIAKDLQAQRGASLVVLAFPASDSIGTKHCMTSAQRMGLNVVNKGFKQ